MKYKDLEKYYLCGIGTHGDINDFRVGIYNKDRNSFSFTNADYGNTELYIEPKGSNATYVISSVCLQDIDDKELLYTNTVIAGVDFSESLELLNNLKNK